MTVDREYDEARHDAVMAVGRALGLDLKYQLQVKVYEKYPQMNGALAEDILDIFQNHDLLLAWVEPFFDSNPDIFADDAPYFERFTWTYSVYARAILEQGTPAIVGVKALQAKAMEAHDA